MHRFDAANASNGSNGTKGSPEFWYYITVSSLLVLAGGVFAGYVFLFF